MAAQTITETFTGSTAPGWVLGGNSYTPVLTSGGIDPVDDGWLRLTDNANNRATYAYYDTAVSSANRTVFTSFDYASYNGTGADGITFFLFDGAVDFSEGAFGGSMGYAPKTIAGGGEVDKEGLAGGYLAISLDDFGNFSNPTEGRTGGPGSRPNAVAVRGPGDGFDGYEFIAGTGDGTTAALTQQLDFPGSTTRPDQTGVDYRHVEILITPTNQLTVWLQFGTDGALTKVLEADLSGYLRPETLKFGFTSGTGGSTEIHELRALTVATLVANLWDNGANGGSSATGDWGTAVNWNPDVPATGDDILFDNTYVSSDQTVNVGTGTTRTIRSIQIDAPFSYTLNNGTLEFDDVGLPGFLGISVTQTNGVSATGNTIQSAISLAAATTVRNATTSTLVLTGAIANGGNALTFDGAGNTTASGVISGTGALVKEQAGNLTLSGSNTYSGGTSVSGGTVTVGHNNALGSGAVTLTGGTLAGSGTPTIANTVSLQGNAGLADLTVSGAVSQTGGDRTLTLGGATISGGVTLAENNQTRTLTTYVTADSTISGVIADGAGSGADGLVKTGSATLTLSGANTYTGGTTINEGSIKLGAADRLADAGAVTIGASGTLDLNGFSERIGNFTASEGGATLDFGTAGGSNTFLFDTFTAPASGVLVVNNWEESSDNLATTINSQASIGSIYVSGYGVVGYNGTATLYGGVRYLLKPVTATEKEWDGTDDATWNDKDNWTTTTKPSSTQIALFDDLGILRPNVTLDGNNTIAGVTFGALGSVSYNITGTRTLTLTGVVPYIQQQNANDQTLAMTTLELDGNTVADITGAGDLVITAAITQLGGTRSLIKDGIGDGKLILGGTGANTYAGGLFINNGIVEARKSSALGTGAATIGSGATLELSGGITPTNAITLGGAGVGGNGAVRNLSGNNTLSGNLTLSNDTRFQSDAGTLTLSGANALDDAGRNLVFGGAGDLVVSKVIATTTGTLAKDGAGTLTLSGTTANTYTGTTSVNGGTLLLSKTAGINAVAGNLVIGDGAGTDTVTLGAGNQIADTATVTLNAGGIFNLNGSSESVAGLNSAASTAQVQLGAGTLTINNSTANTYAGTLSGAGTLTKTGVGRLTLSGSSGSYSGATNVNAGIVAVQTATALGTGTVNVASGGNVEIQGNNTFANAFSIQGDGTGASDGAIENFSGANTLSGNITLANNARLGSSSGTLTLGNTGTLTGTNRNLTISGAGNTIVNRNINTGSGTLTKEGSGTLTLNTANAYTGATTIAAGRITAGTTGIFSDTAALTVSTAAVYDMAGNNETIGSLLGGGAGDGGSINFGGAILTLDGGASSFGGDFGFSNGTIVINAGQSLTLTDSFNAGNI
ncbi:MAG: autotransporter-associated beta strand repeat protein, partial [Rariglobus sp.]|nr:autotransporter-associated beta strand repeat protein [Rariglobus sp.]